MHRHLDDDALQSWAEAGRLPPEAAACPRCRAEWEGYRHLFAALAGLPRFSPSPAFADRVVTAWRPATARRPWWAWAVLPLLTWALAVVGLVSAAAMAPATTAAALRTLGRLIRDAETAVALAAEGLLVTLRDGPWGQAVAWLAARPWTEWLAWGLTTMVLGALGVATVVALGRRTLHQGWGHGA